MVSHGAGESAQWEFFKKDIVFPARRESGRDILSWVFSLRYVHVTREMGM